MSNLKIGDKVKLKNYMSVYVHLGEAGVVKSLGSSVCVDFNGCCSVNTTIDNLIKVAGASKKYMGRRTFRLLKELPDVKKGAIVQEKCDDGDQDYKVLDCQKYVKYEDENGSKEGTVFPRGSIEKEPKFFEEVFPLTESWGTREEQKAFKEFQKAQKAKK